MAGSDKAGQLAIEAGQNVHDAVLGFLTRAGISLGKETIASVAGALVATLSAIVSAIFGGAFLIASELAALFLESMEATTRDNQTAMNDLIAAAMTDLLSVDVTGSDIGPGGDPNAQVQRARQIGGKLH